MLKLRDNALRLQLIVVELTNDDDAYLIFETLNTRGKDLGIADLVKNHLTRMLKPTNKGVDVAKDKWNRILALFDASAAAIDVNAFIYHAWLSRYPCTGKEKLFKELKKRVDKHSAMKFLDLLFQDAEFYRHVLEPRSYKWSKQERGRRRCGSDSSRRSGLAVSCLELDSSGEDSGEGDLAGLLELFLNPQVEQRFRRHTMTPCNVVDLAAEVSIERKVTEPGFDADIEFNLPGGIPGVLQVVLVPVFSNLPIRACLGKG